MKQYIPNLLTSLRILMIPLIVSLFLSPGWQMQAAFLFLITGVTDYFDGYLARRWKSTSLVGRFFDPIADKLLVAASFIALVAKSQLKGFDLIPVIIIICQEIFISGLREFMAGRGTLISVSRASKWKTVLQIAAIFLLMIPAHWPHPLGIFCLWLAMAFSLITAYRYFEAVKGFF